MVPAGVPGLCTALGWLNNAVVAGPPGQVSAKRHFLYIAGICGAGICGARAGSILGQQVLMASSQQSEGTATEQWLTPPLQQLCRW